MKKLLFLAVAATAMMCASCGTQKKTAASSAAPQWTAQDTKNRPQRIEEELDECEKMSMDISDGKLKAYGSALDADRDFARQQATVLARAQLASDIKALVTNVMRIYRASTTKNDNATSSRRAAQTADQMAEECIVNSAIICSKRFVVGDKYESVVCVGMRGTLEDAVKKAVLSDDEALQVEFDEKRFRESYKEELERYRQEKEANL